MREDELGLLVASADRYGDVVRFELGPRLAHVSAYLLRDPDDIHHVLFEARDRYPKSLTYQLLRRVVGNGLVTSEGELWLAQRRTIQPMFRHSQVAAFTPLMLESCDEVVRRWERAADSGEALDVAAEMMRLTLDIVGRSLFSADLAGEASAIGPAVGVLLRDVVERLTSPAGLATVALPRLPTPANRRVAAALATLEDVVTRLVDRRREQPSTERPADMLSMLLAARDEVTGKGMSDEQLRDEVTTFLVAGHETTANALAWTWYLLALYPGVARRVQEELDAVLGGRDLSPSDLEDLDFTRAVVQESMRLYPPVAAIERDAALDDVIGGYEIRAGSTVIISPWVSHRNPKFWPDPEGFDPDRFVGARAAEHPRLAYLPFGAGPRQCIGAGFALQEAVIALAVLAGRFSAELVPGHPVEPALGVTIRPRHGLMMRIRRHVDAPSRTSNVR